MVLHLNKLQYHPRMLLPRLFEIGPVVLEKRIINCVNVFLLFFDNPPPPGKGRGPSFEQI